MTLNKPALSDKVHYSASGGGGGFHPHGGGGGGYGYGGSAHVYSSVGHSGYGGYGGGSGHESHSSKGGKKSVALSALTLLAFLFFLHILQTCLQDQAADTTTTNVVVMAARTENREKQDVMKKRKGDVEDLDGEYTDGDYAEKKSSTRNWEEMDKQVVTTRVKTFTKYDQPVDRSSLRSD